MSAGIKDSDAIARVYCLSRQCTAAARQGFLAVNRAYARFAIPGEPSRSLAVIHNNGVLLGSYEDAARLEVSFLATPKMGPEHGHGRRAARFAKRSERYLLVYETRQMEFEPSSVTSSEPSGATATPTGRPHT